MGRFLCKKYTVFNIVWLLCCPTWAGAALVSAPEVIAEARQPSICQSQPAMSDYLAEELRLLSAQMSHQTFWQRADRLTLFLGEVEKLAYDGLNPHHYLRSTLEGFAARSDNLGLSPCEAQLISYAYLSALHDLHYGRVDPEQQQLVWFADWAQPQKQPGKLARMARLGWADPRAAFAAARPALKKYQELRVANWLAHRSLPESWPLIPAGEALKKGDEGRRVLALRARLRAEGYLEKPRAYAESSVFDLRLSLAVKAFQRANTLNPDGVVGAGTLAQLNLTPAQRLGIIRVNLERFRWLSRLMDERMLLVDITATRVELLENGEVLWSSRVQVGRPERPTPALKSSVMHVTVNPTWTIPPTIMRRDALPRIQADLAYLSDRNIRVFDHQGALLDPVTVDWGNPNALVLRQDPGPRNALGRVAIRFPNPFRVYLHDTPNSGLFERHDRFFSSGCVRVDGAITLTRLLLGKNKAQQRHFDQLRDAGDTTNMHLPRNVALLMFYWTADADQYGNIRWRPDIYQRDQALLELLQ